MLVSTTPRVRVVVLNYDGGEMTLRCLDGLRRLDYPQDRLEIVFWLRLPEAPGMIFGCLMNVDEIGDQVSESVEAALDGAGIAFAFFSQAHERIALVITEFGIGGRADLDSGEIGVGQNGGDGGLDTLF